MSNPIDYGRSLAAIVVGYFFTSFIGFFLNRLIFKFLVPAVAEGQMPELSNSYLIVNLISSALVAFAGGYVVALLAKRAGLVHGLLLGVILLIISLITIKVFGNLMPKWYLIAIAALNFVAPIVGGWARDRQTRPA